MIEFVLYAILFILIGWTLVSFFLVWNWFDARDRLKVVREVTREQTIHAIKASVAKCNKLVWIGLCIAIIFIAFPFLSHDYYGTLTYSGVIIIADVLLLVSLKINANKYLNLVDDYVNENEEHVREAAAAREQQREQQAAQDPMG